jgi:CMP-N-acetylneuraminic acid synthetase
VRHGVECWEAQHGRECRYVAILYGNIPIRPQDLTDRALHKLMETEADSVQSVYPVGKMHPLWMKKLGGTFSDVLEMYEDNRIYRRQDLPPVYMLDAGVLAVTRTSLFNIDPAEPHAFLGEDRRAVVTRPGDVVDIDDPLDMAYAEAVLRMRSRNKS